MPEVLPARKPRSIRHAVDLPIHCMPTRVGNAEELLLDLLSSWVRLLSFEQVGALCFPGLQDPQRAVRRLVARLERVGLLDSYTVVASRPGTPKVFARYERAGLAPDFQALGKALRARSAGPAVRQRVVRLGEQGGAAFGVVQPRRVRPSEAAHELQLAAFALRCKKTGLVSEWVGEDSLRRARLFSGMVPDAMVRTVSGECLVVECGGSYSATKLQRFHEALVPQLGGFGGYVIV